MRLIAAALLAAGCAGAEAPPPDVRCFAARAAAEAEVRAVWPAATVTPHPTVAGRWTVAGPGVAGKIEEAAPDCPGAKLSVWPVVLPVEAGAGGGRAGAGPRHLRISR